MSPAIVRVEEPRVLAGLAVKLPAVFLPDERAGERFFGFFTAHIRNRNTRRAYYRSACRFSDWCEGRGLFDLCSVKPPHVAAYIEMLGVPERRTRAGRMNRVLKPAIIRSVARRLGARLRPRLRMSS
jgi:hypothetical protein